MCDVMIGMTTLLLWAQREDMVLHGMHGIHCLSAAVRTCCRWGCMLVIPITSSMQVRAMIRTHKAHALAVGTPASNTDSTCDTSVADAQSTA